MTMTDHYKTNLRDIYFNLFEVFNIQDHVLGKGPHAEQDMSMAKEILKAFEVVAREKIGNSFAEGDQVPLKLDPEGNVLLPEGLKQSIKDFYAGDWHLFDSPEEAGGFNFPKSVYWAFFEMLIGANPPVGLYTFGACGGEIFKNLATESQQKRYMKNFTEGHWAATMVLTEADAGSDVGSGRAKAKHIKDDLWEIEGVKRFITNGDFDAVENIVHFVLARPEGAESGTKGLSLFIVPKYWVDENGQMVERNGVTCSNLEKKMGIKGSSTCELTFGDKFPARGLLMGDVHQGIKQMFRVIERARMAVGIKSMSTLSTAYLNALEFCKDRIQGPDLLHIMDKNAPRVSIIHHPDVRRMLMLQKSHAEGMRALCSYTAFIQDQALLSGTKEDEIMHDFLLPLVKGYNTEKGYDLLSTSLQCYGGSGYLKDYPIEQYIRDQKIDSLYEGTTHMQALDLIFRKIAKNGGVTFQKLLEQMHATLKERKAKEFLSAEYDELEKAVKAAENIMGAMMTKMAESLYHVGLQGNRILNGIAELVIGWLMVRQGEVAAEKLGSASGSEKAFYEGKLASVRFFCREALPNVSHAKDMIEKSDLSLMELSEEAF